MELHPTSPKRLQELYAIGEQLELGVKRPTSLLPLTVVVWPWTNHSPLPQCLCAIHGDQTKWTHRAPHNSKYLWLQLMPANVESVCLLLLLKKTETEVKDRKQGAVLKPRQNYLKCHANNRQLNAIVDLWESHTITEALECRGPANPESINIGLSVLNTKKLWLPFD